MILRPVKTLLCRQKKCNQMNEFYKSYIAGAISLATKSGLPWDIIYTPNGVPHKLERWNLTLLCGLAPPPTIWLPQMRYYSKCLPILNEMRAAIGLEAIIDDTMTSDWQDFLKAVILNELLVKRNKPQHAVSNIGQYIRVLAACAGDAAPWELTSEIVQLAYNVALRIGESGKHGANLAMVLRTIVDAHHLADRCPIAGFCLPYPDQRAVDADKKVRSLRHGNSTYRRTDRTRTELSERQGATKLPEERAFWELVRIVFTEQAKTFSDAIRFDQVKLAITTGFRIGENTMVPADWERWREYVDAEGRPSGEKGGISRSLMIRHFAEKQQLNVGPQGIVLHENAQHVPPMFEDIIKDSLAHAARITAPMRDRLRLQVETGRLLPEFSPEDLVPAWDLYTRVAGSIQFIKAPLPDSLVAQYRAEHEPAVLDLIRNWQIENLSSAGLHKRACLYWWEWSEKVSLTLRTVTGDPVCGRKDWLNIYLKVGEVEDLIRKHLPTKMPDWDSFNVAGGGKLYAHDLLFLMPVRALVENRNGGIIDVNRYFSIGRVDTADLQNHLGGKAENLFSRYGETDEDRECKLVTHSPRHLQNAELFRLSVADTIISKRFNRRAVAQSHVYDHRSLAEDLAHIELPKGAEKMGPRAQEALRLITSNRVSGPIVEEFLAIQRAQGDDVAFDYLNAEADGLHVTPYGFCLNSFTVDPCPKHLECFNGCRHLTRSNVPEEQKNLERLRDRMQRSISTIEAKPAAARNTGWRNQLAHGRSRLEGIEKALASLPGQVVFPDGPDLFRSIQNVTGTTILDTKQKVRRAE